MTSPPKKAVSGVFGLGIKLLGKVPMSHTRVPELGSCLGSFCQDPTLGAVVTVPGIGLLTPRVEDQCLLPGFWLQPGPAPTTTGIGQQSSQWEFSACCARTLSLNSLSLIFYF